MVLKVKIKVVDSVLLKHNKKWLKQKYFVNERKPKKKGN